MADDEELIATADAFANWFTPLEAVAYAAAALGTNKPHHAIWERLRGGMIRTVALTSSSGHRGNIPATQTIPSWVPKRYWVHYSDQGGDFWQTGDARFFIPAKSNRELSLTVRCFSIRLDPVDVQATLPPLPPPKEEPTAPLPNHTPIADEIEAEQPEVRGPRVSDALLTDWHVLYRRAYQGAADTEDIAVQSARGMFPGKSVARQRVRDLRGEQRRGRKPRPPNT